MQSNPTVKVGYKKAWGIVMLVLAVLNVVLGLMTAGTMSVVIGIFLVVLSILYLTMDYFLLVEGAIVVKNIYGMVMKRYEFDSLSQLSISEDGKRIYLAGAEGSPRRVKVTRWVCDNDDWQSFLNTLNVKVFD